MVTEVELLEIADFCGSTIFTGRMSVLSPSQQCQTTEGKIYYLCVVGSY